MRIVKHEKQIGRAAAAAQVIGVSNRVKRDSTRPRLSVFRSSKHMYAQIIDDISGRTLAPPARSMTSSCASPATGNKDGRRGRGQGLAQRALQRAIKQVAFDRRSYKYHGRVAALADAAREAGLEF